MSEGSSLACEVLEVAWHREINNKKFRRICLQPGMKLTGCATLSPGNSMYNKALSCISKKLFLLFVLTNASLIMADQAISENDVIRLIERMDQYANNRDFTRLKSLISKDAAFAIITKDIDEENTVVIEYDDYFDNIDNIMRSVDQYNIKRDILKVEFNEDKSLARVISKTEESFIGGEIEDVELSTGYLDVAYVNGKLVVIGGMATTESKYKYSLSSCQNDCKDFKTIFPNISSIQTGWLDSRYQGLVIENLENSRSLERDRALINALAENQEIYVLFMAPFEDERGLYRISNTRTLYKLLEDNISDFLYVQYVDPEEHNNLSDYTRYRNSLWLNDQISNLILLIPEQALIVDWHVYDQISIYTTKNERMKLVKQTLDGVQIGYKMYEQEWPAFEMYKLYMSNENIEKSKKTLESLELLNETVSSDFTNIADQTDYIPVVVYDDKTSRKIINQARDMDIMLISHDDLNVLLEKLAKEIM